MSPYDFAYLANLILEPGPASDTTLSLPRPSSSPSSRHHISFPPPIRFTISRLAVLYIPYLRCTKPQLEAHLATDLTLSSTYSSAATLLSQSNARTKLSIKHGHYPFLARLHPCPHVPHLSFLLLSDSPSHLVSAPFSVFFLFTSIDHRSQGGNRSAWL